MYTSGTVFHAFLGQKLSDWKAAASLSEDHSKQLQAAILYDYHRHIQFARPMDILQERFMNVLTAASRQRFTAVLQATIVRYRTGTTARAREYKERKVYDINNSSLNKDVKKAEPVEMPQFDFTSTEDIMLFTTKGHVPNCDAAKTMLDEAGIGYKVIDAMENADLRVKYQVMARTYTGGPQMEKVQRRFIIFRI